ncbi:MAG: DUF2889 domain-containing protein [Alphaproteobacteria bacterium]|nr:DUF2889 domain-containing protein [Alphaproteobacteria bacterium]
MPLSPPAPREHLHTRRIVCEGFLRADGLWDIEAYLLDTKTYAFTNHDRGTIAPGGPLHEMRLRLTLDDAMTVRAVDAVTESGPYTMCGAITPAFKALEGLTVGPGWRRRVHELLGGVKGCTHLVELLGPMATVAFQTIWSAKGREKRARSDGAKPPAAGRPARKPGFIDGCHALASDGPIVRDHHARWYSGPTATSSSTPSSPADATKSR